MSKSAEISEEPEEWSSNCVYSTYDDNEEEDRPLMVSNDIKKFLRQLY
jgi:hypothetical protein